MGSSRFEPAFVEDKNAVGQANGAEAVGDDDNRFPLHQFGKGLLDLLLALRIQGGGGFIQYKDGGIAQECACDGDALLLSAG